MKEVFRIDHWLFSLLCIMSVFSYSYKMTGTDIMPKWYFTTYVLLLGVFVISIKLLIGGSFKINIFIASYIIIMICFIQALYGIGQWFQWFPISDKYKITGSFNNSAGFASCLCAGLPFVLLCLKLTVQKHIRLYSYLSVPIIIIAIVLSESRAGVISIMAIWGIHLYKSTPLKVYSKVILFVFCFTLLLTGSYFYKKNSADGRLLIWRCSWEMIKDAPLLGHGTGGFRAHYMDYQANYFKKHPNSKYAMLADNVITPFNEYLAVTLNWGLLGLCILLTLFFGFINCYRKEPTIERYTALLSLVAVSIFSMFSYPFKYPFIWIVICMDIYIITKRKINIHTVYKKLLCISLILFCFIAFYKLHRKVKAEYKWNKIAYKHPTNTILSHYATLIPILGENPFFLYNYAIALSDANQLRKSLDVALHCKRYWADYDLVILLGNTYKKLKRYNDAEKYYQTASLMCPCRFVPLYLLFELYLEMEEKDKAHSTATLISKKNIKVKSMTVMQIRYRIKKALENKETNKPYVKH